MSMGRKKQPTNNQIAVKISFKPIFKISTVENYILPVINIIGMNQLIVIRTVLYLNTSVYHASVLIKEIKNPKMIISCNR